MPLSLVQQSRLNLFSVAAVAAEKRHGYPAEVIVGQWATESGWGSREAGRNNVFGMTYVEGRHRGFSMVPTREYVTWLELQRFTADELATAKVIETGSGPAVRYEGKKWVSMRRKFADFATLADAIDNKVALITTNQRYATAWNAYKASKNWRELIRGIAQAGYATGPDYAATVLSVAASTEVQNALFAARRPAN